VIFGSALEAPTVVAGLDDVVLTPILGPFGGHYLIVALNAGHPESGTMISFYHHRSLNVFDPTSVYGRGNGFMASYAGIK
jgi:hypothetical protein